MKVIEFLKEIVTNGDLNSKLISAPVNIEFDDYNPKVIDTPARQKNIGFSNKQLKFPKGNFHEREKAAVALHSFANHELLAIEVMAATLLKFPARDEQQKRLQKGILQALKEEQLHFTLYRQRLNELGYEFGDFPLNSFFWQYFQKVETIEQYLSVMALTFEAANLDFATYYHGIFSSIEDFKTAEILNTVLEDEIKHVALGVRYLNLWRGDKTLWEYYQSCLPYPMTPARSKGKVFFPEPRMKAKMDKDFIDAIASFKDEFVVTNRKEWK